MSTSIAEVKAKKEKLVELAREYLAELHGELKRDARILYPWILVYVFPREQQVRGIILPDSADQQKRAMKTSLEGIVLRTWESEQHGKSELEVGDHVLFPHFAGQPYDENYTATNEFRVVKEFATAATQKIGVDDTLFSIIDNKIEIEKDLEDLAGTIPARKILEQYLVYPRSARAKTLSAFGH